jgi:C4-dicarboxylate-specific signal transduction histidine kinase
MGNEILMIRILSNLIKNPLEQIRNNNRGKIFITTERGEKENLLYVKDTAGAAPSEVVEHLFDGYKTTKKGGTGIGLSFSKRTMTDFGGDITCHSEYPNYIEFVLSFPKYVEESESED